VFWRDNQTHSRLHGVLQYEEGLGPVMGGPENDEDSNSLVMKEEKYEAPFMRQGYDEA